MNGIWTAFGSKGELAAALDALRLTAPEVEALLAYWPLRCRPDQDPLRAGGGPGMPWRAWLLLGGRGAGKTRTGAEWVRGVALGHPGIAEPGGGRIALVGDSYAAVRDVMIEGPSGLLAIHASRGERPTWTPTLRRLEWPNGAVAHAFSSEDPDALRGPQFGAAWGDEVARWRHPQETFDTLQFALRLGRRPRQVLTTTPRPLPLIRQLLADPSVAVTRARTGDNAANLAPGFIESLQARYGGTRLGRQELDGELVDERPDALWSRALLERSRVAAAPDLARVVVAVDPPASSGPRADACGIVVAAVDGSGAGIVLADATVRRATPSGWAARAVAAYRRWGADALVVEANQGGEMALAVLREVDPGVPARAVHATRGKYLRAEPVAVLYAQGRVRHLGAFPELEDEMVEFGPGGLSGGRSPDRLDALVWALTDLMLRAPAEPRVRRL